MNKSILIGHVGADPEVRTLESGKKVATFSLATTESYKKKGADDYTSETEWHRIECWGDGTVGYIERNIKKGNLISVVGKIKYQQDKEDEKKWYTKIVLREITKLSKSENGAGNSAGNSAGGNIEKQFKEEAINQIAGEQEDDDDLPF